MFIVTPSIYSADLLDMKNVLKKCESFAHLHADIEDGNFVRGISFGMDYLRGVADNTHVPLDVHLEVCNPMAYVPQLAQIGAAYAAAPVEVLPYPSLFISAVHKLGMKAGLAVNIKTPIETVVPYAADIDELIIITTEADEEDLRFRPAALDKIVKIRGLMRPDAWILADGGANEGNLEQIVRAGANGIVAGRAVFGDPDPAAAYERLLQAGRRWQKEIWGADPE